MKDAKIIQNKENKSTRNKTIDFSLDEGHKYLSRVIQVNGSVDLDTILDKTINGDTNEVMKKLPTEFVDLLVVDPPII